MAGNFLRAFVAGLSLSLMVGCTGLGALPRAPGPDASVTNAWPLYKSIRDSDRGIRETQILWPIYKYREVEGDSFMRIWPVYLEAREEGETFLACTEYQCSALALVAITETGDDRILGLVHFNLLRHFRNSKGSGASVYPLWWPGYETVAMRREDSARTGLLLNIDQYDPQGFRFLTAWRRRGDGHGIFPLYGIREDSWYFAGPLLTRAKDDGFIRLLLFELWPVQPAESETTAP